MSIWDDKNGRKHVAVMVGGKRVHRVMPKGATQGDAKLIEAEIRAAVARSPDKPVQIPGDPLIAEIVQLYAEHAETLRSTLTSQYHVARLTLWPMAYRASQAQEFAAFFIEKARAKYAPATINRSLACLKKGLDIAWRKRIIPENYGLRVQFLQVSNKREVFLDVDQVRDIAQHCSIQAQAAIWAALLTGARRGELLKIRAEHIGQDTIILPSSHTKTKQMRVIPIIPALRPWLEHFPLTLKMEGLKMAWRRARTKADMEHVNFHDLRHSCASIMLGLGVDLYTISKVLGHSNTTTTQRYAHLQVDAQRAALEKLGKLVA